MSMALLRVAAELFAPAFQESMGRLLTPDNVRGLHIRFDEYWYAWAHGWREPRWIGDDYRFWNWPWFLPAPSRDPKARKEFGEHFKASIKDVRWWVDRIPEWELRCRSMGYALNSLPIIFRVIFRNGERMAAEKELPRSFEGFPIVYESRPPAIGLSASTIVAATDSVGRMSPAVSGTAGGFLKDASNAIYVLSCAHVLGSVGNVVTMPGGNAGSSGVNVGTVVRSVSPPPNPPNTSCSGRSPATVHNLDIAVAEIHNNIQPDPNIQGIGKPTFITPVLRMRQGDQVGLVGQKSGKVDAEIDDLTIFHEIEIDNQPRCFGNIYSLSPPKPWYVNTKLVKSGDSGSWILRRTNSLVGWDGVLVAGDGAHAYACFAEDAFDDVAHNVSQNIALL
jgi:hypothetical protein